MSHGRLHKLTGIPEMATCLGCRYRLRGLPKAVCPECGREFDPADADTYRLPDRSRRAGWRQRCAILPGCVIAYTLFCAIQSSVSPTQRTFSFRMQGPVLLASLSPKGLVVFVITLCCLAMMLAHPVKPGRGTAVVTILGFVLWYACSWVAWEILMSV